MMQMLGIKPAYVFYFMLVSIAMFVMVCISNSLVLTSRRYDWSSVNSPECMDCVRVNQSMDIKVFEDFQFPEPNCFGKLLVYECVGADICGGLADRQKGIVSAFLLALLTNRTFVLNHRKSCDMKKIMPPRVYNWFKCMPYLYWYKRKGQHVVKYIDGKGNLPSNFSVLRSGDLWIEHIVKLHVNTRFNVAIKEHPDAKRMLPWLFNASEQDVLAGLL